MFWEFLSHEAMDIELIDNNSNTDASSTSSTPSTFSTDDLILAAAQLVVSRHKSFLHENRGNYFINERINWHSSIRLEEILNTPQRLFRHTELITTVFWALVAELYSLGLTSSRYLKLPEKLLIFLHTVRHGGGFREVSEELLRPISTASVAFAEVLGVLAYELHRRVVRLPNPNSSTPTFIAMSRKFMPYFKDCIGALDG